MPTIKDIVRHFGVSPSTVSIVLSGKGNDRNSNKDTQEMSSPQLRSCPMCRTSPPENCGPGTLSANNALQSAMNCNAAIVATPSEEDPRYLFNEQKITPVPTSGRWT